MRITVGTGYDAGYKELGDYTSHITERHAKQFFYRFVAYRESLDERPAPWHKILFAKEHLPHCDWFLWVDADACLVGPVDKLVNDEKFLIIGRARTNVFFNTGAFLLRNCEQSFRFLDEIYQQEKFIDHPWWEQKAAIQVMQFQDKKLRKDNEYYRNMQLLRYGRLWSRPEDMRINIPIIHCPGPHPLKVKLSTIDMALTQRSFTILERKFGGFWKS